MRLGKLLCFCLIVTISFRCGLGENNSVGNGIMAIDLKLKFGNEPMVILKDYKYPDGRSFYFNRFSFFLDEITVKSATQQVNSKEAKQINFSNKNITPEGAKEGVRIQFESVPEGVYTSLKFCIGVKPTDNAKDPASFLPASSLSDQAEYWTGWKSYIFSRTEGFIDLDRNGSKEKGFSLHTGANDAYTCVDLPINVTIEEPKISSVGVAIDLAKLFGTTAPYYDIDKDAQIHSLSQAAAVKQLANNLKSGITIE
jgi:hypothetical protein